MSVTIKELVDSAAVAAPDVTKKQLEAIVESVFTKAGETLKAGQDVTVRNFGRFYVKARPARVGRNPKTGAAVNVPAKSVIKFTPRGDMKA